MPYSRRSLTGRDVSEEALESARAASDRFARRQQPLDEWQVASAPPVPPMSLGQLSDYARRSGIHPDHLGPCRRAAAQLKWVILFRTIKQSAMDHAGDFDKLPKPMEIKVKCDPDTGMVMFKTRAEMELAIARGDIDSHYAKREGLTVDKFHFLVNKKGLRFYSDMDLFDVYDAETGEQIDLGDGRNENADHAQQRMRLDRLINVCHSLGAANVQIQHGAERQWYKHNPRDEQVTAFTPNGNIYVLSDLQEIEDFLEKVRSRSFAAPSL
jgi:hypothetical protein